MKRNNIRRSNIRRGNVRRSNVRGSTLGMRSVWHSLTLPDTPWRIIARRKVSLALLELTSVSLMASKCSLPSFMSFSIISLFLLWLF